MAGYEIRKENRYKPKRPKGAILLFTGYFFWLREREQSENPILITFLSQRPIIAFLKFVRSIPAFSIQKDGGKMILSGGITGL